MKENQQIDTLFEATDTHLVKLQRFLDKQKESFQHGITNDNDYEKIIAEANQKTIQNIDDTIKYINNLRQKLKKLAADKVKQALKNRRCRIEI